MVDKLSTIDPAVIEEMLAYARAFANRYSASNPMMWSDELEGEFGLEIAKCLNKYGTKPEAEFKKICKRMIANRLYELRYRFYITHRKAEASMLGESVDADQDEDMSPYMTARAECYEEPECNLDSKEQIIALRSSLSKAAKAVLDVIIDGSARMDQILLLLATRSTYSGKPPKLTAHVLADALLMDEKVVAKAVSEIAKALEYDNE